MAKKKKETDPNLGRIARKAEAAGTKVSHTSAKKASLGNAPLNRNQSYTSDGAMTQGYKSAKQAAADGTYKNGYTKTSTSSKYGRLAIDLGNGKTDTKNAQTWSFDLPKDERTKNRKNGRSMTVNRRKRDYDVRVGLNNDQRSPEAIARLRAAGLSDAEIGIGSNRGGRALATG